MCHGALFLNSRAMELYSCAIEAEQIVGFIGKTFWEFLFVHAQFGNYAEVSLFIL